MNSMLLIDFYKSVHKDMLPKGIDYSVSYYTPRQSLVNRWDKVVMFSLQGFIKTYLIEHFNTYFFNLPKRQVMSSYERILDFTLGKGNYSSKSISDLHELGYLPVKIKGVPEGTMVPVKVPMFSIENTHKDFAWLPQALESLISAEMWHPMLSATVGKTYRDIVNKFYDISCDDDVIRSKALGDFSFRGQECLQSAVKSSAAWLLSFENTATVPAIPYLEENYNCNCEGESVGFGAVSTEHSVMCSNFAVDGDEITFIRRAITELYPETSFSMVLDSYDYWNVVKNILPQLKDEIFTHKGYVGVRGDCYDKDTEILTDSGWKKFYQLNKTDSVMQILDDGSGEFVLPIDYIEKKYRGDIINFSSKKSKLDFNVTPNHTMVVQKKDKFKLNKAKDVKYYENANLPTAMTNIIGEKKNLSDWERLMIAFQADGRCRSLNKPHSTKRGYGCEFSFSKQRKIDRMESILKNLNIDYTISYKKYNNTKWKDMNVYNFNIKDKPFKFFNEWIEIDKIDKSWCVDFIDEISLWDGHSRKDCTGLIEYTNTSKSDVEMVQTIATMAGYHTNFSIRVDNRSDKFNDCYRVFINKKKNFIGGDAIEKTIKQYNDKVYCVTVPSGKILVKRNNQIFISGNCGNLIEVVTQTVFQLWEDFGGTINSKGYKVLHPNLKVIYADGVTVQRLEKVYEILVENGFACNNVFLGVGSFSFQSIEEEGAFKPFTRDTFGVAIKATYCEINGVPTYIYKNPKGGSSKRSQKGLCYVGKDNDGNIFYKDELNKEQLKILENSGDISNNMFFDIFEDGEMLYETSLSNIRSILHGRF